jgi:hypothetical protein
MKQWLWILVLAGSCGEQPQTRHQDLSSDIPADRIAEAKLTISLTNRVPAAAQDTAMILAPGDEVAIAIGSKERFVDAFSLSYRAPNSKAWIILGTLSQNESFSWRIPAELEFGFGYYLQAKDDNGVTIVSEAFALGATSEQQNAVTTTSTPVTPRTIRTTTSTTTTTPFTFPTTTLPATTITSTTRPAATTTLAATTTTLPAPPPTLPNGTLLWTNNCQGCHGSGAAKSGRSSAQIKGAIANIGAMARFRGQFADGEIDAIAAYLRNR